MMMKRSEPPAVVDEEGQPCEREEPCLKTKPFTISKREVWAAYQHVRSNRGAAGVDGQTIEAFEQNLKGNLYKLWNRLSSGSYYPPAVLRVEIPKASGGKRPLGIPTVTDRVAQQVVKQRLEPLLEPHFHQDSYGYRPGKSAHEALAVTRRRCWERAWVLEVDIKGFFDNIDHGLLMKAVEKHVSNRWMRLYIERWLRAPLELSNGQVQERSKGTPQGGVISPVLANLFLHYAFDKWMERTASHITFERYADDIVCHCHSESEAKRMKRKLAQRMQACGLELHPEKTGIVYCKSQWRKGDYPRVSFDFLGYTFKPRKVKLKDGRIGTGFVPAISGQAKRRIWQRLNAWGFRKKVNLKLEQIAEFWNPILEGWLEYYGRFYRTKLYHALNHFDSRLAQWTTSKYHRTRSRSERGWALLMRLRKRYPNMFAHWRYFKFKSNIGGYAAGRAG